MNWNWMVSESRGVRVPTLVGLFDGRRKCPTKVGTLTPSAKVRHYLELQFIYHHTELK